MAVLRMGEAATQALWRARGSESRLCRSRARDTGLTGMISLLLNSRTVETRTNTCTCPGTGVPTPCNTHKAVSTTDPTSRPRAGGLRPPATEATGPSPGSPR